MMANSSLIVKTKRWSGLTGATINALVNSLFMHIIEWQPVRLVPINPPFAHSLRKESSLCCLKQRHSSHLYICGMIEIWWFTIDEQMSMALLSIGLKTLWGWGNEEEMRFFFFLRDFIFKKTLFEKLQYLKQEQ